MNFFTKVKQSVSNPKRVRDFLETDSFSNSVRYLFALFILTFIPDIPFGMGQIIGEDSILQGIFLYFSLIILLFTTYLVTLIAYTSFTYICMYLFYDKANFKKLFQINVYSYTTFLLCVLVYNAVYSIVYLSTGSPLSLNTTRGTIFSVVFAVLLLLSLLYALHIQIMNVRKVFKVDGWLSIMVIVVPAILIFAIVLLVGVGLTILGQVLALLSTQTVPA